MPTPPPSSTSHSPPNSNPPSSALTSPSNSPSPFHSSSPTTNAPLSDIPRLCTTHTTSGYRDGIALSKESTLQTGFDEGYPLGAEFGLRVGWVLGVLEGVERALRGGARRGVGKKGVGNNRKIEEESMVGIKKERERVGKMLKEAREKLGVERVFGGEWWGGDGWGYKILGEPAESESGEANEEEGRKGKEEGKEEGGGDEAWGKGEVTFKEVVDSHPVVRQWVGRVRREMERWGIREDGGFGGEEWEAGRVEGEGG